MNAEIAKMVLEGEVVNYGRVGNFMIAELPNNLGLTGTTKRVDWGNTNSLKKHYLNSEVDVYNKELSPDGKKYFQYHANEVDYWWIWMGKGIKHRMFFKFMPNNYYHRFHSKFEQIKRYKSKDEIYKDNIGNAEKMRFLIRFDPLHYLNYRKNYAILKHKSPQLQTI
jgi:hypothetical protein